MQGTLDLSTDEVHVWLAFEERILEPALLAHYHALMTPEEAARQRRFVFERDRHRYLVTRALVRTVLSRYVPVAPRDWTFTENRYGKPTADNAPARDMALSFNVTHTQGLVAIAVTRKAALGVDAENTEKRQAPLDVAGHFFAPDEVSALAGIGAERQHDRFFQYWTLKESYIKARGMGLSIPLDKFAFLFHTEDRLELTVHPELADVASRWHFWQFRPPGFLLAVCAQRIQTARQRIVLREVVPLQGDSLLDSPLLCMSA
ncbi:4'-phosphopantetheinyl transferase superfamily protein [Ramlibacter sp.]|uniref:4'-phosphopantetheinyl transferase family protein n=1 Tax=Ramlibacter sp. TaxID=1917967 RepID=UPI0017C95C70|nr:4'-phosphopantetheinyl transferase superfamily protein [Ramlibacter sp.]MBA2675212.1 4'-phosphopantetheinyl transferase superfamily protein [Ramlibacter sp.]